MSELPEHVRRNLAAWDRIEKVDLPHGEMIRLLDSSGFDLEALIELQAPDGGSSGQGDFVSLEWARRWPSEEIWRARER